MKLPLIIAAGTLTAVVAYNAYALTCGAQPSCDSLGYKYTGATTDCLNTPIKCPFNSSYFNCVKKVDAIKKLQQDIVTAVMPDYKKILSRALDVTYTADTNGFIIGIDYREGDKGGTVEIWINGTMVRVQSAQTDWSRNSWSYPVKKGSPYRVNASGSVASYYFVPTI